MKLSLYKLTVTRILLIAVSLNIFTSAAWSASKTEFRGETILAPANDNFASAQMISGVSGSINLTTAAATKEAGEPAHALNKGGASVWYKFVAPGNGVLTLNTFGSSFDTLLAVYAGSSLNNLRPVAANDDLEIAQLQSIASKLSFGTQTNTTYYIALDGENNGAMAESGTAILNYEFGNSMLNDNFAGIVNGYWLNPSAKTKWFSATNVGASKELGEPNHAGNAGGKSVWFKWSNNTAYVRTFNFSVETQALANLNSGVDTLFAIYTGSSVGNLTPVASKHFGRYGNLVLQAAPFTDYYLALDGFDAGQGADTGNFTLAYGVLKDPRVADFDRDGKADLTVFRPTTGSWYSMDSITAALRSFHFGANGDKPLLTDFDHDGNTDFVVFRPDIGTWYTISANMGFQAFNWGLNTDVPVLRNTYFNGITNSYPTVFRPSSGTWWIDVGINGAAVSFGQLGDIPISADFTGDGNDEITVFRPSNGTWYVLNLITNQYQAVQFGQSGDKPVPADYDGDGRMDIAVFRPATGVWHIIYSSDNSYHPIQWGQNGDRPQAADYDNDGYANLAVFRNGTWYLRPNFVTINAVQFGLSTDIQMTSPTW
ncbi:MAG: VCBS repeat-containing protein [Pyrinomonadaceae bacterium]